MNRLAKVVFFAPRQEMIEQAQRLAPGYRLDIVGYALTSSSTAVLRAPEAVAGGAQIIIARGLHAMHIRQKVDVPVVEIRLTGQEMGLLVSRAKEMASSICPKIAVIGFQNMFCDMSAFDSLFGVEIHPYFVRETDQLLGAADEAIREGAQVVIGGDAVCERAKSAGIPALFLASGPESIAEAFRIAEKVAYSSDLEKRNTAQIKALLDYSFNGIIQTNAAGEVQHLNHFVEKLTGKSEEESVGLPVTALIPSLDPALLDEALGGGREVYSTLITIQKSALITNIAPILIDSVVQGAFLSFHEGKRVAEMEAQMRREIYKLGHVAKYHFDNLVALSAPAREAVKTAKFFARSDSPILITGEFGTEKELLAECIHNDSVRKGAPFVSVRCDSLQAGEMSEEIFGAGGEGDTAAHKCLADMAKGGTLFLDEVDALDMSAQYKLFRLVRDGVLIRSGDTRPLPIGVRVIAASGRPLGPAVREGHFRRDLYYALDVLSLSLLPLRRRREDIEGWAERFLEAQQHKQSRYLSLTAGARRALAAYAWEGNLPQLESFCERVVALAPRRTVDEVFIAQQLEQCYPAAHEPDGERVIVYQDPDAQELKELLKTHRGNRQKVARELGVSTTTLWRRMKKYGISGD